MKLVRGPWYVPAALLCSALLCGTAPAQNTTAYLYIAQAASGRNVSATANPAFPLDFLVNGTCLVRGETFGQIIGPLSLPAGTYSFEISAANTKTPCSNPSVYSPTVTLNAGTSYFGIVTLDASNNVTGQIYDIDFSSISAGWSRVEIANATNQNLTAALRGAPVRGSAESIDIGASSVQEGTIPSGTYRGSIYLQDTHMRQAGPATVDLFSRDLYFYVIAGSAANNSVQFLGPLVIRDVF